MSEWEDCSCPTCYRLRQLVNYERKPRRGTVADLQARLAAAERRARVAERALELQVTNAGTVNAAMECMRDEELHTFGEVWVVAAYAIAESEEGE